jgi:hypothetical protein
LRKATWENDAEITHQDPPSTFREEERMLGEKRKHFGRDSRQAKRNCFSLVLPPSAHCYPGLHQKWSRSQ